MSKKVGVYKVGDFVFGKVKYWPPWPAKIQKINRKKYVVKYYGTGETGTLKIEDLCPYEENKSELVNDKTMKRSDFKAGVFQIEKEILEKEARAIEQALEEDNVQTISNMNEEAKSLKRKTYGDNSNLFKESLKMASLSGAASEPINDRLKTNPKSYSEWRKSVNSMAEDERIYMHQISADPMNGRLKNVQIADDTVITEM